VIARKRRRAGALRESLRALGTLYVPDRLYAVRLAAKKLLYCLEVERSLPRVAVSRDLQTLESIQEHLGLLHDLQMLQSRLRSTAKEAGVSRSALVHLHRMGKDVETECRGLHAAVIAKTPRWDGMADRIMGDAVKAALITPQQLS
jgi:CHAD domain-containing protein